VIEYHATAINTMGRPLNSNDPLPRELLLVLNKIAIESQFAECFTALGWDVDTRRFVVALTDDKFMIWMEEINSLLQNKQTKAKDLVKIIRKLNWAAKLLLLACYFLHCLRKLTFNKSNH